MAVRILVPGRVPEEAPMDAKCGHCGCQFQFTAQDAKRVSDQRDGDFWSIACPTCRRPVTKQTYSGR